MKGGMQTKTASSRSFGLLIAAALALAGGLAYWNRHTGLGWLVAAGLFFALAVTMPRLLAPLKYLWLAFGHVLHVAISPILLGLLYVVSICSVGLMARLFGKD